MNVADAAVLQGRLETMDLRLYLQFVWGRYYKSNRSWHPVKEASSHAR